MRCGMWYDLDEYEILGFRFAFLVVVFFFDLQDQSFFFPLCFSVIIAVEEGGGGGGGYKVVDVDVIWRFRW